ncbi:MAG TPA: glutathione peroxidase [Candidatus Dormibacteraeota bacterium]|jgi:glutathione peroxidase
MTDPSIYDLELTTLAGEPASLGSYRGRLVLAVNVASRCGLTPQYEGLERLHRRFADQGLAVLGFPCNQFGDQEPGTAEEIRQFCDARFGVSFPMFAKLEVNGAGRHPLYAILTETADDDGKSGDVLWNFEKFLVSPDGEVLRRFRPMTAPEDPDVVSAIEANLPVSR